MYYKLHYPVFHLFAICDKNVWVRTLLDFTYNSLMFLADFTYYPTIVVTSVALHLAEQQKRQKVAWRCFLRA